MNSWCTGNGYKIVRILDRRSNVYLIEKEGFYILIDTGKKNAKDKLLNRLNIIGVDISKISLLILTHTHYDHCQSAYLIKQLSKCEIIVSVSAKYFIPTGYTKIPKGTIFPTKQFAKMGLMIGKHGFGYRAFVADRYIEEDTILNFQNCSVKIINTPGHSVDSITVIIDDEIAIVGDTLFGKFKNSVFPPFADNVSEMIESWGKLLQTDCKIFLPGHGNGINRNLLQKEYDKFKRGYL